MITIMKERITPQKTFIISYLRNVKTHPTAEEVYEAAKRSMPKISRGTGYRILGELKKRGDIKAILTKGFVHFDADTSPHSHFICEACGKVIDVSGICSKCGILKNKKLKVGKINYYNIHFYGKCKNCMLRLQKRT